MARLQRLPKVTRICMVETINRDWVARVYFPNRYFDIPYYRKLTLHEIKALEINANLMENYFRIKKINAKEEVEFHNKGN